MISRTERRVIENFLATMQGQTLDEALANAELDAKSYGLSRAAARELGARVRARFTNRTTTETKGT